MAHTATKTTDQAVGAVIMAIDQDSLRERVRSVLMADSIAQAQMARECGLSSSMVSQFLSGTYNGDRNKVATAMMKWLNGRDETAKINAVLPQAPAWIPMPTANRILDTLIYAHRIGDIAVVYGGAGLCKSSTIEYYRKTNTNVWMVVATPATASSAVLLEEIGIAVGLVDMVPHPAKLQRAILAKIRNTGGVIIIDEAQHLSKAALETARSIHDFTGIGLVLSGNAAVYNNLYKGGSNGFAQLFSRVGKRLALSMPVSGDIHALANAFDVSGTPELRELEKVGRRAGALRMVSKVLRLASVFAAGNAIALQHIQAAAVDLQGEQITPEVAS